MNLVTGATGIIGSHVLLELLRRGKPVRAAKRNSSNLERVRELFGWYDPAEISLFDRIEWIDLDILDVFELEEALKGVQTVYHCAGFVAFTEDERKKLFAINEQGTANVVNAALEAGASLCHVSSIAAISHTEAEVITEAIPWKRKRRSGPYALSKQAAEREVWRGVGEGLDAVIVNPGVVLSPVFWDQSSGTLIETCYKGMQFYTQGIAAYVAAPDVASSMVSLVEGGHFGNRYILVEGNYNYKDIFTRIARSFNHRPPFIPLSPLLMNLGLRVEPLLSRMLGRKPVLSRSLISSAFNRQVYDGSKVWKTLGLRFEPVMEFVDRICANYQTVRGKAVSSR